MRIYKKAYVDIVDTMIYFNLLALAVLTLYDYGNGSTKQIAIAYISTFITFFLLIGAIIHHVTVLFRSRKKNKISEPLKDVKAELYKSGSRGQVTNTVVELFEPLNPQHDE